MHEEFLLRHLETNILFLIWSARGISIK